jgi:hypothetical protein
VRTLRQCVDNRTDLSSRPFPFAKGPFVAYSHIVAAALVATPILAADERYALTARKQSHLHHPFSGNLLPPRSRYHPRHGIVYDDVYYGYLVSELFAHRKLTFVQAALSEFRKQHPLRLDVTDFHGFNVRIYHTLKSAKRYEWIANSSRLRRGLASSVGLQGGFCCMRAHGSRGNGTSDPWANLSQKHHCCERWLQCVPTRRSGRKFRCPHERPSSLGDSAARGEELATLLREE